MHLIHVYKYIKQHWQGLKSACLLYKLFISFLYLLTYRHPQKFSVNLRELRACQTRARAQTWLGPGLHFLFFSGPGPGPKIFLSDPDPCLVLTRSSLILAWNLNTTELKSPYNTFVLLFSTKRQLLIFGALIDRNKHQEMIVYRFFYLNNQL